MGGPCMTQYIRRLGAPFVLVAALSFGACTVSDSKSDTSLSRDTALNRDLELANRDSAVQPQLKDVPATPAAEAPAPPTRTTTPAPKPAASRPAPRPRTTTTPPAPTTRTTASGNT